jgi:Fe-S oxidoreductase
MTATFGEYLDEARQEFLAACTACGKCFEACPVVPLTSLAGADAGAVMQDVLGLLRGEDGHAAGAEFVDACTRCGQCLDVCPEHVNPRRMLTLAKYQSLPERPGGFMASMNKGIKMLSGLQLTPQELRLLTQGESAPDGPVDVVFHASCNLLRTPHIALNVMQILDAIGTSYVALGGARHCCGSPQLELRDGGRDPSTLTRTTLARFAAYEPAKVLSWCPSCLLIFGESLAGIDPSVEHIRHEHVVDHLAERVEQWRPLVRPLERRVAVHLHPSAQRRTSENALAVLRALPGVTVVDLPRGQDYFDWLYVCSPLEHIGRYADAAVSPKQAYFEDVAAAGVDELLTLYHPCHRYLVDGEVAYGFRVRNLTDLFMEALGLEPREDRFKEFKNYRDVRAILDEAAPLLAANGLDRGKVEDALPGLLST